jgi:hypothetical protein
MFFPTDARARRAIAISLLAAVAALGCQTAGSGSGNDGTGGAGSGSGGATGAGGSAGGRGGAGVDAGSKGGTGGGAAGSGGRAGSTGSGGAGQDAGSGGSTGAGGGSTAASCTNGKQDGTETGVDCGGSCGACPTYMINPPNLKNAARSGCLSNGTGFMCTRQMVFSSEFKQAAADDWGSTDPPFVYGVVGHDKDSGGLDTNSGNTCCECYQLVFTSPQDPVSGVATPKPMIVQTFNTAAGGGKNFDIYMAMGGYGSNQMGCPAMYSSLPSVGEPNNGGVRVENASECRDSNGFSAASISTASCQQAVDAQCAMIQSTASASNQSESQTSCIETNQPDSLYHMNWNVMAKRVECPTNLTRVTGCKLGSQGLPMADPTAKDAASATSGFSSGYTTTTMQDCCRPTCAYNTNVMMSGVSVDSQYGAFYTCDMAGNPS